MPSKSWCGSRKREMRVESLKRASAAKRRDQAKAKKNHGPYLKEIDKIKRQQKKYRGF